MIGAKPGIRIAFVWGLLPVAAGAADTSRIPVPPAPVRSQETPCLTLAARPLSEQERRSSDLAIGPDAIAAHVIARAREEGRPVCTPGDTRK